MPDTKFIVAKNLDELSKKAASLVAAASDRAIARNGRFTLVLSGGSTPKNLYELLATPEWRHRIDWTRTEVFWGDERMVPPDHPDSNYKMAYDTLLSKIAIPEGNIHRVKTELNDAPTVARACEEDIYRTFGTHPPAIPQFDFILLGMGENGHTASLFPFSEVLSVSGDLVAAAFVQEVSGYRITFSAPLINHASEIAFLVTGANKASTVREVVAGPHDPHKLPSQLIQPANGTLYWILDEMAAAQLPRKTA